MIIKKCRVCSKYYLPDEAYVERKSFMRNRVDSIKFRLIFLFLLPYIALSGQRTDPGLNNIQIAWQLITNFYVDTINSDELAREAIEAMLRKLDPHSVYIPADDVNAMNEPLDGNFEGVGIEFVILDDTLTVVSAIAGGPSEKVGIRGGRQDYCG